LGNSIVDLAASKLLVEKQNGNSAENLTDPDVLMPVLERQAHTSGRQATNFPIRISSIDRESFKWIMGQ
jgi:hypothetical protein